MDSYGKFDLNDYHFERFLPSSDTEEQAWTIVVTKDDQEVYREVIPLFYRPIFGPDVEDLAECDDRIEEIIIKLNVE